MEPTEVSMDDTCIHAVQSHLAPCLKLKKLIQPSVRELNALCFPLYASVFLLFPLFFMYMHVTQLCYTLRAVA